MARRLSHPHLFVALLVTLLAAACDSPTEPGLLVPARTIDAVGDVIQLEAVNAPQDRLPFWESLDPTILTVTPAGMATAMAPGAARVRARIGSRVADGTITVLPSVQVTVSDLAIVVDSNGEGVGMRLRNAGGRGYYKLQYWVASDTEGEPHRLIQYYFNDHEAEVGMDVFARNFTLPTAPDWVVVYSRTPASMEYQMTGCARLDGGSPCPMP